MGLLVEVTPSPGNGKVKRGIYSVQAGAALDLLIGKERFARVAKHFGINLEGHNTSGKAKKAACRLGAAIAHAYPKLTAEAQTILTLPNEDQKAKVAWWFDREVLS